MVSHRRIYEVSAVGDRRYNCDVALRILLVWLIVASARAGPIAPPPAGKFYFGCYWGGVGTDTHDPSEHDVTPVDVVRYEAAIGTKAAWVYFSDNWFESRKFPTEMCRWIRDLGKVPYIRLMLRSTVDQNRGEKRFTLHKIIAGDFDVDLRAWAREAKAFGTPILIEWGTEPNGDWFGWSAKFNGGESHGPKRYVDAYRHIVDVIRGEGADNLTWVWHVNWLDQPEEKWNAFEKYFPGNDYCDWVALSAYGPTTPTMRDGSESFAFKMKDAYPRLAKIASGKPMIIAEFGCDIHNPRVNAAAWAKSALDDLFSNKWPAVIGFCWWNEGWQNDNHKKHDTDMIITHDADLARVFHEEFDRHEDKMQEAIITATDEHR